MQQWIGKHQTEHTAGDNFQMLVVLKEKILAQTQSNAFFDRTRPNNKKIRIAGP